MFEPDGIQRIIEFFQTYPRYAEIERYRRLRPQVGKVKNLFYGDSITSAWPLHEFFPNHSTLNRGIGGDNVYGLHYRMEEDVFPYRPERVFMLIGINGIDEPRERLLAHILALADRIRGQGSSVALSSILPLREPDRWNRCQYQEKIVMVNNSLREAAAREGFLFMDYHHVLKDSSGQLAQSFAQEDGTHVTFDAYQAMAEVVRPWLVE